MVLFAYVYFCIQWLISCFSLFHCLSLFTCPNYPTPLRYVLLLFIFPLFRHNSRFWLRLNRRKWSMRLRGGCMRKVPLPMERTSILAFCRIALPSGPSRWSLRRARARSSAPTTENGPLVREFPESSPSRSIFLSSSCCAFSLLSALFA